jgi:hypothetical protein
MAGGIRMALLEPEEPSQNSTTTLSVDHSGGGGHPRHGAAPAVEKRHQSLVCTRVRVGLSMAGAVALIGLAYALPYGFPPMVVTHNGTVTTTKGTAHNWVCKYDAWIEERNHSNHSTWRIEWSTDPSNGDYIPSNTTSWLDTWIETAMSTRVLNLVRTMCILEHSSTKL